MDYKKLIDDYKDEAIKMLADLVSYPSVLDEYKPNTNEPFGKANREVLEYLLNKAEADGFKTLNSDNYAGHVEFGSGTETLGILAHLDVVPVNEAEWTTPPFKLDIRDGKMFARGSVDDKGPLVAAYIAMKILKDTGFKPSKAIRLIAGCDEESGSRCLEHYFDKVGKPDFAFSPDAEFPLINGEKAILSYDVLGDVKDDVIEEFYAGERYNIVPSEAKMKLKIDLQEEFADYLEENKLKGKYENGYYIAYGTAAHGSVPEEGINAAYILFDFLSQYTESKLAEFVDEYFLYDTTGALVGYDLYTEEMGYLSSNFAVVRVKDGKFKFGVNCRVPADEQYEVVKETLAQATAKYGYEYKMLGFSPRHYVDVNSDLVQALMKAYKLVTKEEDAKPFTIGGGTYARELPGKAVAFGPVFPGREDVCHIANEYMFIEDLLKAIEIYIYAIYDLTK